MSESDGAVGLGDWIEVRVETCDAFACRLFLAVPDFPYVPSCRVCPAYLLSWRGEFDGTGVDDGESGAQLEAEELRKRVCRTLPSFRSCPVCPWSWRAVELDESDGFGASVELAGKDVVSFDRSDNRLEHAGFVELGDAGAFGTSHD